MGADVVGVEEGNEVDGAADGTDEGNPDGVAVGEEVRDDEREEDREKPLKVSCCFAGGGTRAWVNWKALRVYRVRCDILCYS